MSSLGRRIAVVLALLPAFIHLTRLDRPGLLAPGASSRSRPRRDLRDAAYHPSTEPAAFERLWAGGELILLITRWGDSARELLFHYPERTRVIAVDDSTRVPANHDGGG